MSELDGRVCPRCGGLATEHRFCPTCGLHLAEEPELPTRTDWEAARASESDTHAHADGASALSEAPQPNVSASTSEPVAPQRRQGTLSLGQGTLSGRSYVGDKFRSQPSNVKITVYMVAACIVAVLILAVASAGGSGSGSNQASVDTCMRNAIAIDIMNTGGKNCTDDSAFKAPEHTDTATGAAKLSADCTQKTGNEYVCDVTDASNSLTAGDFVGFYDVTYDGENIVYTHN